MRTLLLPVRLAFLPVRLLLFPFRRRRGEKNVEDLVEAIEDFVGLGDSLEELDAEDIVEAVGAVVEEAAGRSRRSKAARGFMLLLLLGVAIGVAVYLLRQRRDFECARLETEPERPDLTPADPVTPVDSTDGPVADDGDDDSDDEPALDPAEQATERAAEPVAG